VWNVLTKNMLGDLYTKSENGQRLRPVGDNIFWYAPAGTIMHDVDYNIMQLVDDGNLIKVRRAQIISAQDKTVMLSTGETIPSDGIVFCTGWELSAPHLFPPEICHELGLPTRLSVLPASEAQRWKALDSTAEEKLLSLYPILRSPPADIQVTEMTKTPFRLFRSLVPSSLASQGDNSCVFVGYYGNSRVQLGAEIASLWAVAYLESLFPSRTCALLSNKSAMDTDIALNEAYRRKRYLNSYAYRFTLFENQEFNDVLLEDLGIRADRKRWTMENEIQRGVRRSWGGLWKLKAWWREWFEGYFAEDYKGIVDEFLTFKRMEDELGTYLFETGSTTV